MAPRQAWADAYLAQSRADLRAAELVASQEPSVFAMLLQMAFEKLAKAALLRSGAVRVEWAIRNHNSARRMIAALWLQRGKLDPLGGPRSWDDVRWVIETLERSHPQNSGVHTPQLEYPWESAEGEVHWPAQHLPIAERLALGSLGPRVLRFAKILASRLDQIFPPNT